MAGRRPGAAESRGLITTALLDAIAIGLGNDVYDLRIVDEDGLNRDHQLGLLENFEKPPLMSMAEMIQDSIARRLQTSLGHFKGQPAYGAGSFGKKMRAQVVETVRQSFAADPAFKDVQVTCDDTNNPPGALGITVTVKLRPAPTANFITMEAKLQ